MITICFSVLLTMLVFKFILLAFRATWGILKVLLTIFLFPAVLIGLFAGGFVVLSYAVIIIAGLYTIIRAAVV